MKKRQENSTRASALQITLSVALILLSGVLLASSFKAAQVSAESLAPKQGAQQANAGAGLFAKLTSPLDRPAPPRQLSRADRIAYQYAIEEVYWRYQIWPKERPDPKPSLDQVMTRAQIEQKVEDYLRNSQALEDYWQQLESSSITASGYFFQAQVLLLAHGTANLHFSVRSSKSLPVT